MSASTENYNGWKNYPTWAVNLWLSNVEGLYNETFAMAERAIEAGAEGTTDTPRADLADALRDWVAEMLPDLGASFAADLLGYAVDRVDWHEIAEAWLSDVRGD